MVRRAAPYPADRARSNAEPPHRRIWAEVDHAALARNVRSLRAGLRRGCHLIAVVKGDAYGHGATAVARSAVAAGASALAVASATEGAELRAAGITAELLVIGPSLVEDLPLILEYDLVPAIADLDFARALEAAARGPCRVQVEVETGLSRFGIDASIAFPLIASIAGSHSLRLAGVYTHFSALQDSDVVSVREQFTVFEGLLAQLHGAGLRPFAHACNTLSSRLLPDAQLDALRIGGGLHGLGSTAAALGLTPILSLHSQIAALQPARAGERVGYGATHCCPRDTLLAILPCGYADGLVRSTWNGRDVLVRGQRAPIVGLVSMNQLVIDVGAVAGGVAVGDEVVLIGQQGGARIRAEERLPPGCSAYELTTLLQPCVPRCHRGAAAPADARRG